MQSDVPLWLADLPTHLATHTLGHALVYLPRTPSTNAVALEAARTGTAEGTLFVTDDQYAGRGRMGRSWQVTPGANLTFSLVVRPALPVADWPFVGFAAAIAVARALEARTPQQTARLKWPNDVLLGTRKVAGLLLETAHAPGVSPALVLGIGANVNQQTFPAELEGRATSLALVTGTPHDRGALLADLLNHLEPLLAYCSGEGRALLLQLYTARLAGLGGQVVFHETATAQPVEGRLLGLNSSGALQLDTPQGVRSFRAGDLTTHRA